MVDNLNRLMLEAIQTQVHDEAARPTFSWTDGLSQMTLGIWATGRDQHDQPYLCLGEPEEEDSEMKGNGGTVYLGDFQVTGISRGVARTTRFDLRRPNDTGEYFVWVAGDWGPGNGS